MSGSKPDTRVRCEMATDSTTAETSVQAEDWLTEHGDALYRFARLRVGKREVAEDLVQDTFLAAIGAREPFRGHSTVRTWLISILRRKIVDHYRRVAAARARGEVESTGGGELDAWFTADGAWRRSVADWQTPPQVAEDREFRRVVDDCLSRLPRLLASAFILRELDGMEVTAAQESLETSAGNIRVRLFRARQLLRTCLEKHWFGNNLEK